MPIKDTHWAGLILNVSGKVVANYWLNYIYPAEIGRAHREGDFHIHDLDMLSGYCAGWSLRTLLNEGFKTVCLARLKLGPLSICPQLPVRLSTSWEPCKTNGAGAQAFSSFDTYLAPFH